jgi:hypothetical protein
MGAAFTNRYLTPLLTPRVELVVVIDDVIWGDDGVSSVRVHQERLVVDGAILQRYRHESLMSA